MTCKNTVEWRGYQVRCPRWRWHRGVHGDNLAVGLLWGWRRWNGQEA